MAININTAATKELTQLPGIAKNLAYRIVAHRRRHGWFSQWEELAEVKEFPIHKLEEIKKRATLEMPEDGTPRPSAGSSAITSSARPRSRRDIEKTFVARD